MFKYIVFLLNHFERRCFNEVELASLLEEHENDMWRAYYKSLAR
jgi:hypothetical protein